MDPHSVGKLPARQQQVFERASCRMLSLGGMLAACWVPGRQAQEAGASLQAGRQQRMIGRAVPPITCQKLSVHFECFQVPARTRQPARGQVKGSGNTPAQHAAKLASVRPVAEKRCSSSRAAGQLRREPALCSRGAELLRARVALTPEVPAAGQRRWRAGCPACARNRQPHTQTQTEAKATSQAAGHSSDGLTATLCRALTQHNQLRHTRFHPSRIAE